MRWSTRLFLALGLSLAAGSALACPPHGPCEPRRGDAYEAPYVGEPGYGRPYDGGERDLFDGRRYDRFDDGRGYGPPPDRHGWSGDRSDDEGYFDERYYDEDYGDDWDAPPAYGASPWYRDGRRPAPLCGCNGLRLSNSFFYDAGGVGPIPVGAEGYGYGYGGGYVVMGARSSSRAFASASASASANVSVRFRGGYRGHGHKHGHGGKRR